MPSVARVVIAAGGTAGHVVPALVVADALRDSGAEVSFVGTRDRAEASLVAEAGYEIDFLELRGIDRRRPLRAAGALARAAAALPAAGRILRERDADAVMGGGGYVAGPVGLAGLRRGLPLVLTEADSHLGLTNRLLARRARRVCLAFPIPGRDGERYLVTGRPVPPEIGSTDRDQARARFGIEAGVACLLVFGGSLGAGSINDATLEAFAGGAERDFHVLHISGPRDYPEARRRIEAAAPQRYTLLEYEPGLGDPLAACDLVLARAGGSVFELAAAGRPALLVPYPHAAADHQRTNAEWMAAAGAAEVIDDARLSGSLVAEASARLLADHEALAAMSRASAGLARPDAAKRIATEIIEGIDG